MNRTLLKQESKKQLSKNFGTLILTGLLLGVIMSIPSTIQSLGMSLSISSLTQGKYPLSAVEMLSRIVSNPVFITCNSIASLLGIAVFLFAPVLNLGVHHVYLKATADEKPSFSEMFSKMSQFGSAFLSNLLIAIFTFLWSLLLVVPGIIAAYSYAMTYFVLAEHPEFGAMQAIKESKRIMKGHKFELFVLELSFFWWYLLCIITFGLAMIYVIPYVEMAKANFYNKIKG